MIAIVLAALSGLVWGTGDFAGGKASQRTSSLTTAVLSKTASLPVLAIYLVVLHAPLRAATLGWGALAGLFGMAGMIVFYRALAGGAMAVVAPVSAVTAAVVPLVIGLIIEEPPGPVALVGAACAIVAIALVSMAPGAKATKFNARLVLLALGSGAGFGLFFVFLKRAGDAAGGHAGLWPVLAAHTAALTLGGALLLRGRLATTSPGQRPGRESTLRGVTLAWIIVAGVLDMTANVLYLLAVQGGLLSIVAPVASLYPVTTVLLAMLIDRERMRPIQLAGLGLAAAALVLVAS